MSYNIHLEYRPDPNTANSLDERKIYLYSGDGNVWRYEVSAESHPVYGEVWKCSKRNDFLKKWSNGTYTLYLKKNRLWQFDNKGYIDYISNKGQVINFGYNSKIFGMNDTERLDYIEDNYHRRTNLIYSDPNGAYPGNLLKIVDSTGREWTYDYYTDGNLKKVTDPNGYTETYEYDDWCRLTTVHDNANNIWLDNDYDSSGRVYQQTLGGTGGPMSTITYNPNNRIVTDANGFDETFVLNDDGFTLSKTTETDYDTVTTLYERNGQNNLTKITYPEGNGYDLTYDSNGNLTSAALFSSNSQDPNLVYTFTGTDDDWSFLKTITDPENNTTTYTYDYEDPNYSTDDGLLMKITYPQVMTDTGLATPKIELTYNSNNQVETITSPDDIVLKYEYWTNASKPNSLGKVKKVILDYGTDPNCLNVEYTFDYDGSGRVVDVNDPFGNTTTLTFNAIDLLSQIEDPDGNIAKLSYNADRKLSKVERAFDGGWQTFEYGYNIMAKLNSITDSLGNETTLDYDDRFQVKEVTDSNTNATKKRYNARRLIKEIIDAEDGSTTFDYDDNGRLSVVTDAEDADTTYDYDGYGRLEHVTYADNSFEEYGYDDNGNLTSFTNRANETITFGYDALNRLIDKKVGTDPNIVLTYDIAGRLVEVAQSTKEMTFDYDRLGRLTETIDQNNNTVSSDYDAMGRRSKLTYPDNSYITYEYDDVGRLQYIKDSSGNKIAEYSYDELSRTAAVDYYRGTSYVGSMDYDYEDANSLIDDDLGNRIEQIEYDTGSGGNYAYHSISYTYDSVGNVTSADVGGASGDYGWTYGYDKVYQVTDANQILTPSNREVDISYDSVFNRTSWYDSLLDASMSYEDNALNQYTTVSYNGNNQTPTYDDRGNCTSWGTGITCSYDEENRLVSANSVSYTYDLLGRRLSRTYGGTTTTYVWDGAHIIAEYENGSLTKKYIYGPGMDNTVAMINVDQYTNETWYYYYADALGSVRLLSDAGGVIVEGYTYWTYGQPIVMSAAGDGNWLTDDASSGTSNSSSYGNPYMFTGRRWDSTTTLYYYRFRDYSPLLGRFLQADPAGYIDTMNLYAYCGNNPVNFNDPFGEARRQKRPLDTWGLRHTTIGPLHHDRFLYNDGTDSGYYDDSRVRKDRANLKLQGRYKNVGSELDDQLLRQAEKNVRQDWDRGINPKAKPYKLKGKGHKNCQDYCDAVEEEYERLEKQQEENSKKGS